MSTLEPFHLTGPDGKHIRGDRALGKERQILFITGFLSKRWGNKSKALAQWCEENGWGFCCYDVRGFGDSEGRFIDYTLSDWIADARAVLDLIKTGPPITVVGNSLQVFDSAPTVLGDDGTDTLLNFEYLKFSDALISVPIKINSLHWETKEREEMK